MGDLRNPGEAAPRRRRFGRAACAPLLVLAAAAWAAGAAEPGPTLQKIRDSGVIRIGYRTDALPFSYVDANKRPIGYAVELCAEAVAALRRDQRINALRIEYVPVTSANRLEFVQQGQVDIGCDMTVRTAERAKLVAFSLPYYFSAPRLLVKTGSPVRDFPGLNNRKVGVVKGTNVVPMLRERLAQGVLRGTVLVEFGNNEQALAALERGEVDAFSTTDNVLFSYRANAANPRDFEVVGSALVYEPVAVTFRHNDPQFAQAFNRALSALMLDGVASRLYTRWFLTPVPPKGVVVDLPMSAVLRDHFKWPVEPR